MGLRISSEDESRALYIRIFKAVKSFNPSADPSFSLILRRKVAEGFELQTLQTLQQPFSLTFPDW